jgi:hypothetical protein
MTHNAGLPNLVSLGSWNSHLGEADSHGPAGEFFFDQPSEHLPNYPGLSFVDYQVRQ